MTVKIVPTTKDVIKAFALSLLEIQKVILIPAAVGLIRGNRKHQYLMHFCIGAELLLAEPFAGTSWTKPVHGSLSWLGVDSNPKHTTKPPAPSGCLASVASCEWPLLADQRLQESPSFCSELQLRLSFSGGEMEQKEHACHCYITHLGWG